MFVFSRLFNTLIAILFSVLLAVTLTITVYTQSTIEVVGNRDNIQRWLAEDNTQEALIDYVIESAFSPVLIDLGEKLLGEDKYEELIYNQFTKDATEYLTDTTIDALYDWLEGETAAPIITLSLEETNIDVEEVESLVNEQLGALSEFVNISDILLKTTDIEILDLDDSTLRKVPQLFGQLKRIPQVFLVISLIFAFIIIFAAPTWRQKILFVSLSAVGAGLIILLGFRFYPVGELFRSIVDMSTGLAIPEVEVFPEFIQLILISASEQIASVASNYATYMLVIGGIIALLSQIAIRSEEEDDEYEIESGPEWVTDESYYDSEELEESE